MKDNPQVVIDHFANVFEGINPSYFAGGHEWSDGTLFQMDKQGEVYVIKVLSGCEHSFEAIHERISFARYLAEHGIATTKPEYSANTRLAESTIHEGKSYHAVCWKYICGKGLDDRKPHDLSLFYHSWGKLMGKMHRLAQAYPTWLQSHALDASGKAIISRKAEWKVFFNWLLGDDVKQAWLHLGQELDNYPVNRTNYGFVHNDAHPGNMLQNDSGLVLLDFDVANCLWFALDLAICFNSEYARIMHHSKHKGQEHTLKQLFMAKFMQGYTQENSLADSDLHSIGSFIHYRHFLMYAVFYNQIKDNAPKYLEIMKGELLSGESYIRREVEAFFA